MNVISSTTVKRLTIELTSQDLDTINDVYNTSVNLISSLKDSQMSIPQAKLLEELRESIVDLSPLINSINS